MLLSVLVHALVSCTIRPLLYALAELLVLEPLAHVRGSIRVLIGSVAVGLVVQPLSLVDVAISMDERSVAIGLISLPLAIVLGAILPDLLAVAIFHTVEELARVDSAVTERDWAVSLPLVADHLAWNAVSITTLVVVVGHHVGHHSLVIEEAHGGLELALVAEEGVVALHILEGVVGVVAAHRVLIAVHVVHVVVSVEERLVILIEVVHVLVSILILVFAQHLHVLLIRHLHILLVEVFVVTHLVLTAALGLASGLV
mmetsp:Transcript_11389/g.19209  ORF Transcript_11389/g.19209 Transcript_11389/m.19209 type:complete len:257 (-) Transcript_11389:97-867(-)